MQTNKKNLILLCNLGTPNSTKTSDIRDFLRSLLQDPNIKKQSFFWRFLLNCFILPLATVRAKKKYDSIWLIDGSPLLVHTKNLADNLEIELNRSTGSQSYKVLFAMSYSNPKLSDVLNSIDYDSILSLTIVPLFPQYSLSTTGSVENLLTESIKRNSNLKNIPINFIKSFSDEKYYIDALSQQIENYLQNKKIDLLLISFHSLPNSLIRRGDPYKEMCEILFQNIRNRFKNRYDKIKLCYQSAGKIGKWLQPTLRNEILSAVRNGEKNIAIISPSFLTECSETLIDIKQNANTLFLSNGGSQFTYIPCLNSENFWIENFAKMLCEKINNVPPLL